MMVFRIEFCRLTFSFDESWKTKFLSDFLIWNQAHVCNSCNGGYRFARNGHMIQNLDLFITIKIFRIDLMDVHVDWLVHNSFSSFSFDAETKMAVLLPSA